VAWLLLRHEERGCQELDANQLQFVEARYEKSPEIKQAAESAHEFRRMIRERDEKAWSAWQESTARTLLAPFARYLLRDEAAVKAALTMPWSNGQTEGQVQRLKLIKRQTYGRAKLDLLKARVLHKAA
jgi:transposase